MTEAARGIITIMPVHLVWALALVLVDRLLMICLWVLLLRRAEMALSLKSAVWVFLVGSYLGNLLPSGVGADAVRVCVLTQRTERGIDAIALVAIDRYLGLFSLAFLATAGLVVWTGQEDPGLQRWSYALAGLVILGAAGLLWADRLLRTLVPMRWTRQPWVSRALRLAAALVNTELTCDSCLAWARCRWSSSWCECCRPTCWDAGWESTSPSATISPTCRSASWRFCCRSPSAGSVWHRV